MVFARQSKHQEWASDCEKSLGDLFLYQNDPARIGDGHAAALDNNAVETGGPDTRGIRIIEVSQQRMFLRRVDLFERFGGDSGLFRVSFRLVQ